MEDKRCAKTSPDSSKYITENLAKNSHSKTACQRTPSQLTSTATGDVEMSTFMY